MNLSGWYRNPDDITRSWERQALSGDTEIRAHLLAARLRQGDLDYTNVVVAAYLSDPAALMIVSDPVLPLESRILETLERIEPLGRVVYAWPLDYALLLNLCADFLEHTLYIWKNAYESSFLIDESIRAAREIVSFEEARSIRLSLMINEDPYNPAAMEIAEQAANLAELVARFSDTGEQSCWMVWEMIKSLRLAVAMTDYKTVYWEKHWQIEHTIGILLS